MYLLVAEENLHLWESIIQLLEEGQAENGNKASKILVLFLTEKDLFEDRIIEDDRGIQLNKSIQAAELKSRIRALLREKSSFTKQEIIRYRGIQLLGKEHGALVDGNSIKLTAKQYRLLELLIQNKGAIVTKEQIYDSVWGLDCETTIAIVEVFIHQLRKKLEPFGYHTEIKTIRGTGYMLSED